jgi:hypothetical protein
MIRIIALLVALALAVLLSLAGVASAEGLRNCGPRRIVLDTLAKKNGETRRMIGLTRGGMLFEMFAATGGTWSFVLTPPGADKSCLVAAGQNFESFAPGPAGEEM